LAKKHPDVPVAPDRYLDGTGQVVLGSRMMAETKFS